MTRGQIQWIIYAIIRSSECYCLKLSCVDILSCLFDFYFFPVKTSL